MFVSFEVVRKCFESGAPSGCSPVEGCSSGFFFGKRNIATLQVASCDCVAGCANFVCGATNATHCRGEEGGECGVIGCAGVGVAKVLLWRCAGLILIYAACSTAQS